jgi:hypothetical protein
VEGRFETEEKSKISDCDCSREQSVLNSHWDKVSLDEGGSMDEHSYFELACPEHG